MMNLWDIIFARQMVGGNGGSGGSGSGGESSSDEAWTRPEDWPDIDALAAKLAEDEESLYLTYDLRKTAGYGWIGLYVNCGSGATWMAERGHIEDGEFVVDDVVTTRSDEYLRQPLDEAHGDVQLWRIRSTSPSDRPIVTIGFATPSTSVGMDNAMQPCVQRAGRLPWCFKWGGNPENSPKTTCGTTYWMERDAMIPGNKTVVTSLSNLWISGNSLKSIDVSGWDTSKWEINSLSTVINYCYSLHELDLSAWDTSNWAVTTIQNMIYSNYNLKKLNISGWDTKNWAVSNANCAFSGNAIEELDLSGWDTSGWPCNTIANFVSYNYALKTLNMSGWDTGKFFPVSGSATIASFAYMCTSLRTILGMETWRRVANVNSINNVWSPASTSLTDFKGIPYQTNHSYGMCLVLSIESLISILNTLPSTGGSAKTITLGSANKTKLTAEQIAVATQKGWTVA